MQRWHENPRPLSDRRVLEVVSESFNEHEVVLVSCARSEDYAAAEGTYHTSRDRHAVGRDPDPLVVAMRSRLRGTFGS